MGDRTWLSIEVAEKDKARVIEINGYPPEEEHTDKGIVQMHYYEVNYGGWEFLGELENADIDYLATHGHGGSYGPSSFACIDGTQVEVQVDEQDSGFIIPVSNEDIERGSIPVPKEIEAYREMCQEFYKRYRIEMDFSVKAPKEEEKTKADFISDFGREIVGEKLDELGNPTGEPGMRIPRYGVWGEKGRGKSEVIETGNDLAALRLKYGAHLEVIKMNV